MFFIAYAFKGPVHVFPVGSNHKHKQNRIADCQNMTFLNAKIHTLSTDNVIVAIKNAVFSIGNTVLIKISEFVVATKVVCSS